MTTRERILTIRLAEKLKVHPAFAKALGVEAAGAVIDRKADAIQKGLTVV